MRWIAGLLLTGAAILKASQLVSEPSTTLLHPFGTFFLPIQIGLEFAIGLLALNGAYWRALRWPFVLLFSGFTTYSLYLALSGAASCGCFGALRVHPWWAVLLDSTVAVGIFASALHSRPSSPILPGNGWSRITTIVAVAVIITALLLRFVDGRFALAGERPRSNAATVLEPQQWIGQQLPIADFIDRDLSSGDWLAVLHRHDCPVCQEVLPYYEELALKGQRVALIEIPPYGYSASLNGTCLCCRLRGDREWFVETPVEIRLQAGFVTSFKSYGH